ncbi:MAG TPA: hypothetical protein VLA17_02775, partial [Candidatus Limnocylindria bacterium]|nr:hypothetical protein [Candidatus Limnocylindria bacterium]
VYAGSLGKTLRSYENDGDTRLVVMRSGIGERIVSFLQGTISIQSMFKRPAASSVLLLDSGTQT